jgi:hypothetical protein
MNLKTVTDRVLIEKIENLVKEERELLTAVLRHLREIDRRRLFSSLGDKSLFDFAVRCLGYPEDQAYRRISAMRLLEEIPEIEDKINAGEISLTHIGLAQSLFRQEKKIQQKEMSHNQKLAVLEQIANKSVREAERITLSRSSAPEIARPDRVNPISESRVEMRFTASADLQQKIECLKGWLAHKHPRLSLGELFEKLCDLGLSEWSPTKTAAPRKRRIINKASQTEVIRHTFQGAENKCENCGSSYALEVDHIVPKAKGGASKKENLRILCRSCNQRAAVEEFGIQKMDQYIN